jgi:hypothetical protein
MMMAIVALLLLLLSPSSVATAAFTNKKRVPTSTRVEQPHSRRIVAIGDLHGDAEQALGILTGLGIANASGNWVGGRDILVQLGDIVDRGSDSLSIYETLFRLQDEASLSGGEVILLLGNHELLNMDGDFRYANSKETEQLGDRTHAFGLDGWPGKELRRRGLAVARIGEAHSFADPVIFTHGGLQPSLANSFAAAYRSTGQDVVDAINDAVHQHLAKGGNDDDAESSSNSSSRSSEEFRTMLFGDSGPFWTRHFARTTDPAIVCRDLEQSLKVVDGVRMVVGHTAQSNGKVNHRCAGRLLLGDTEISKAASARGIAHPSAIEFVSATGDAFAVYPRQHLRTLKGQAFSREILPKVMPQKNAPDMPQQEQPQRLRWWLETLELGDSSSAAVNQQQLPSKNEVRRAFKRLSLQRHPDRGGTELAFQELQVASQGILDSLAE